MSDGQRDLPTSELDMSMMMTNSLWGRADVPDELKERLSKIKVVRDEHGKPIENDKGQVMISKDGLWGLLGFYTRDMRLANLSEWNGELQTCRYMIDLANDYLSMAMLEPFMISLSRAVSIMETSQSKGGFLRKMMNTLTQVNKTQNLDPPKKGFFGKTKQIEGG